MLRPIAAALLGFCFPLSAQEPSLEGFWRGAIETPGQALEINLDFIKAEDGSWRGNVSIPAQQAQDLELVDISFDQERISFRISGIPGNPSFQGAFSSDGQTLSGRFTQGAIAVPFKLKRAENAATRTRTTLADLEQVVARAMADFHVPGLALAVVVEGEVALAKGFGYRDVAQALPVTTRTVFAIGSATKAFTTAVLGSLADEGLLEWDKPVVHYLPDFRLYDDHATQRMTVRDLVTHRSGLPRHDLMWYNTDADRESLFQRLRYLEPHRDLREQYHYQNLMYFAAGYLAERLTGKSWETNVQERIMEPLGMSGSNFSVLDSQKAPDHALPYREEDGEMVLMPFRDLSNMGPAGSINSNIEDMTRWIVMQLNGGSRDGKSILKSSTLRDMHTPHTIASGYPDDSRSLLTAYGMGWFVQAYRGHYLVQHGGNIDGFSALVCLLPLERIGLVILANQFRSPLPGPLANHILDHVLELETIDWLGEVLKQRQQNRVVREAAEKKRGMNRIAGTQPSRALAAFTGSYHHPGYGDAEIALSDGRLQLTYHRMTIPLDHWHYDVFSTSEEGGEQALRGLLIQFRANRNGYIGDMVIPLEVQVSDIIFEKKPDARLYDPDYLSRFEGRYHLPTQTLTIERKGGTLFAVLPAQPPYELEPNSDGGFNLKNVSGYWITFVEENGRVTQAHLNQPNGVFVATRDAE